MSLFPIPVKTQEPVSVTPSREGFVRRVIRKQWRDVNGNVVYWFVVPTGYMIRPTQLIVQTDVQQPAAGACFAGVWFKSATQDNAEGNWIWSCLLPTLDTREIWHILSRSGGYGTYDNTNAYFGWTYRMNHIPFPDTFLLPSERIVVEAFNFGATDTLTLYLSYEEYKL